MLRNLFRGRDETRAVTVEQMWGPWYGSGTTNAGISVSRANALQLLAVYGSAQLLINEISTCPLEADAEWVENPTPDLRRIPFVSQLVGSMALDGTSYTAIIEGTGSRVVGVQPLDPQTVYPYREGGVKRYRVNGQVSPYEIVEIPLMTLAGSEKGLSPVEFCRQSIGLGLAAQEFGANFFNEGANMPGVITSTKAIVPEQKKELAEQWKRKRTRGNRGLPGVLDDGATWLSTGVTNEQAQFLATRQFTAAEIAGQMFLVDPTELGIPVEGSTLTYQNLAQRNTRRITFTCMPYIRRIEEAFAPYARGHFRFNVDAKLRGDTKTSYETLAIALENGFMTVDEVRDILGMPPMPKDMTPNSAALASAAQKQMLALLKGKPDDSNPVAA